MRRKKKGGQSGKLTRQDYKRRIVTGIISVFVMLCIAASTFYIKDTKAVEFIKWAAGAPIAVSGTIILVKIKTLLKCSKFSDVFRILISSFCLWTAVLMLLNGSLVMGAAAWNVMHAEANEEDKKKQEREDEDKAQMVTPKRNDNDFVWEDDVFIEDISKYYDGTINEEEEDKYILELLKEYFENQDEDGMYNRTYEDETALANQYYKQYLHAVDEGYALAVQHNALYQSKVNRKEANISSKVAANLKDLGNTEVELGELEKNMGNENWQNQYVDALGHYIKGLKCSIREVELGWYDTKKEMSDDLWEHIVSTYEEIDDFTTTDGTIEERAKKIVGILKNVEGFMF